MRIVFIGSAASACTCLDRLLDSKSLQIAGVVTRPDRPKGRSLRVGSCAVRSHLAARGVSVPVLAPEDVNSPPCVAALRELAPELIVVVAYGKFLRKEILGLPPRGCINMHASLLPKYRGAAPIQWAIANGEIETGVTTIMMNERMDAGDIIGQISEAIRPEDTAGSLRERLVRIGSGLLEKSIESIREGSARARAQDESSATFAPRIKKIDGRLDWRMDAGALHNRVRAFNPQPCCYCEAPSAGRLRVMRSRVEPGADAPCGAVLEASGDGPLVQAAHGALRLLEIQPESRKVMSGADFLRGYPLTDSGIFR